MTQIQVVTIPATDLREMLVDAARIGGEQALRTFVQASKAFDPAKYGMFMSRKQVSQELNCSLDKVDALLERGSLKRQHNGDKAVLISTESFINYLYARK